MNNEIAPVEGNWYLNLDNEQAFEVVSVDKDSGLIEIQYADGSLEEVDLNTWDELEIEPTEATEEWEDVQSDAGEIDYDQDEDRDLLENEGEESRNNGMTE